MRTAALICVLVVTAGAATTARASASGVTWIGTVGFASPTSAFVAGRRANARLVISPTAIVASFEGYTGASHDPLSARTSCSMRYKLVKREGAWSYYHQVGRAHYAAGQYVQNAPCESVDYGAVRTTPAAAGKLRADFGSFDNEELFEPAPLWRSYLRRA